MKFGYFFMCILLICGCATSANYEKILQTWIGSSEAALIGSWGPPQSFYELADGSRVLEYVAERNVQIGGYTYTQPQTTYNSGQVSAYGSNGSSAYGNYSGTSTTYVTKTTPTNNLHMVCKTRFTLNSAGVITNTSWQGNDCKAYPPK